MITSQLNIVSHSTRSQKLRWWEEAQADCSNSMRVMESIIWEYLGKMIKCKLELGVRTRILLNGHNYNVSLTSLRRTGVLRPNDIRATWATWSLRGPALPWPQELGRTRHLCDSRTVILWIFFCRLEAFSLSVDQHIPPFYVDPCCLMPQFMYHKSSSSGKVLTWPGSPHCLNRVKGQMLMWLSVMYHNHQLQPSAGPPCRDTQEGCCGAVWAKESVGISFSIHLPDWYQRHLVPVIPLSGIILCCEHCLSSYFICLFLCPSSSGQCSLLC